MENTAKASTSTFQKQKIEDIKSNLNDLFDVAHQNALTSITEEYGKFLLLQREKGRPGWMGGVDIKFVKA